MTDDELHEAAAAYARKQAGMWCDHPAFQDYKYLNSIRPGYAYSWDREISYHYHGYVAGYRAAQEKNNVK